MEVSKTKILSLGLFFLSGLTSLIYQIIWIRQLSLAVGSTSASMSLVLSIFFFGLAAGSYLAGRYHDKISNPLWVYGKLEGLIGLYSAGLVYVLFHLQDLMVLIYPGGSLSVFSHLIKFVLVFFLLILPTLAMGATLPLLVKAFQTRARREDQASVSLLYGVNTFGAVAGAFLSGFFLIPTLGVELTNHVAVLGNLVLLGIAYFLRKQFVSQVVTPAEASPAPVSLSTEKASFWQNRKLPYLLMSGVAGFATLAAEVVWSKYLGIFMGTNIYGLSLILSLFLFGIALGSLLLDRYSYKISDKRSFFFLLCILLLGFIWLSTTLLGSLPLATTLLGYYTAGKVSLLTLKFVAAAFILIGPTIVSGMLLPLGIELLADETGDLPRATGQIYSINTVGSILGSYASGVLLIPLLGSAWTLKIGLIILLAVIIFTGLRLRKLSFSTLPKWSALAILGIVIVAQEGLHFKNIIRSAYHQSIAKDSTLAELLDNFSESKEQFIQIIEGQTAVISLSHDQADGEHYKRYFRLKTNGLNESIYDSQNRDSLPKYEALLGLLPYVFNQQPESAFLVGYGGGYSVDFLSSTPLKKVFVTELEKGILQAADYVHKGNNPILKRPNVDLRIEDARFMLAVGADAPFDIIASQPSHSWLSGVANLFTEEFFALVKSRLKPTGVFSQWLNLYNIDVEVLKSILKTFYTVFPHGAVFTNLQDDELILIGSLEPLKFDMERANQLIQDPKMYRRLQNIPLRNAYDLLTHMTVTRDDVLAFAANAPINTDRNAYAETRQSKLFYGDRYQNVQSFLDGEFTARYDVLVPEKARSSDFWFQALNSLNESQNFYKYNRVLEMKRSDLLAEANDRAELARAFYQMERYASARDQIRETLQGGEVDSETLNLALNIFIGANDYQEAIQTFRRFPGKADRMSECLMLETYASANQMAEAKALATKIEESYPTSMKLCGENVKFYLGHYYFKAAQHAKAIGYLDAYYRQMPSYLPALKFLVGSLIANGADNSAYAFIGPLEDSRKKERDRLVTLRDYYQQLGATADAQILTEKVRTVDL